MLLIRSNRFISSEIFVATWVRDVKQQVKVYLPDPIDIEYCIAIGTKGRNKMLPTTCVVTCHKELQCNNGL